MILATAMHGHRCRVVLSGGPTTPYDLLRVTESQTMTSTVSKMVFLAHIVHLEQAILEDTVFLPREVIAHLKV
jgi:hypothetical protein